MHLFCHVFVLSQFCMLIAAGHHVDEVEYFVNLVQNGIEESFRFQLPTSADQYRPTSRGIYYWGTYDFIVAGTGTSGATLAGRLAQISKWTTLALEAGTFEDDFVDIPAMHYYERGTKYNWAYTSVPQTTCCLALINRTCPFPRGRAFGGSSVTNAGIYARANRRDFDRWAAEGNPGWNYDSVLEYFARSENATLLDGADVGYHGYRGPLDVRHITQESEQTREFINANVELGMTEGDYNGREQMHVSRIQTNLRHGRRLSSARAFLDPVKHRRNLELLDDSFVTRVYVKDEIKLRAVFFTRHGQRYVALARKEIILSAGAFGSPQILMLSGIGPHDHLHDVGIPVVKDLSVGDNLQDHPLYFGISFETDLRFDTQTIREYVKQYLRGTGFYTVTGNLQGIGFYDFDADRNGGYPDIEMILLPSPSLSNYTKLSLSLSDETFETVFGGLDPERSFVIYIILLRPESVGKFRLRSRDPYVYPLIDPNWFTDPHQRDLQTVYRAIMFIRDRLGNTEAFRRMGARMKRVDLPDCSHYEYDSQEYWYCYIRYLSLNIYHPCCTARMGPDPRKGAVVDSKFRVHGYKSLRVVDASAFPFSFSGHPAANCIMIGERAFDFILKEHLKK